MTLFSAMKESESRGEWPMPKSQLESLFDGNLCRCTGYRPILDVAKSFSEEADIEDLVAAYPAPAQLNDVHM